MKEPAQDDLLLIPSGKGAYPLGGRTGAYCHLGDQAGRRPMLSLPVDPAGEPGNATHPGKREIVRHRERKRQPLSFPIFAQVAHLLTKAAVCRSQMSRLSGPVDLHHPVPGTAETEERADHLRSSRPHQPRDTENLTSPELEARLLDCRRCREVPDVEKNVIGGGRGARGEKPVHRTADHLVDEVIIPDRTDLFRVDSAAIAQDGVAVGDLPHLLKEVTDVDDRNPAGAKAPDEREKAFDICPGEAAGRLVHQNDACACAKCPADLHDLLRRDWKCPDDAIRPDLRV